MFRPIKIRQHLAFMKARGYAEEKTLAGSGVTEAMLSDPAFLMDIDQYKTIVSNMIVLTGDQGIGLEVGAHTEMVDLGLLGYLMMSAQTTHEAAQYWINFSNALVGVLMEVRLEENTLGDLSFVISESVPLGFIYNFCVEEQLVMIYKLGGELGSVTPVMKQLELSYPAPAHHARYEQYFKGPIKFNARATRITFSSPRMGLPLRGNDQEFNKICIRQCEFVMRQIGQRSPFVSKIQNILMRSRGKNPGIDAVARELNMSPRSLNRHLSDEGSNFRQLTNEFRANMAKEYLRSGSITPKEIAYLLGFKDTNSFRRAFKLWSGKTVNEYRDLEQD